jgi:alpha-beta hydrolase superfamily lysophospholipase
MSLDNDSAPGIFPGAAESVMNTNNIVLVHGLWMTPLSFEYWAHHYGERGYSVIAPSWPGMERDIRALRREPGSYAGLGFKHIVDHYEELILDFDTPPIIMGHCFGGLVVQALLDRGLGACGVAIASAPIKGVWTLPYSTMRVVTPQLLHPRRCVPLTPAQFHYAFMHTSSAEDAFRMYQRYAVPGVGHVLFQAEFANFNPFAETAVNTRRNNRAPLLMIAGSQDHLTPPSIVKANVRAYRHSTAVTEYKEFADRTHLLIAQSGWQEVAGYALDWARDQELIVARQRQRIAREAGARSDSRRVA